MNLLIVLVLDIDVFGMGESIVNVVVWFKKVGFDVYYILLVVLGLMLVVVVVVFLWYFYFVILDVVLEFGLNLDVLEIFLKVIVI